MITVKPRASEPGYADIELHDGTLITWDLTIPEAEKLAQEFRDCDHEPTGLHGDGHGGWLCDACGALVEQDWPRTDDRLRIEQSNDVAGIVFEQVKRVWPDLHPVLDLRYGVADALWDAGYRKTQPTRWRDRQGDVWTLGGDGLLHARETAPSPREHVEKKWGPLVPTSTDPRGDDA